MNNSSQHIPQTASTEDQLALAQLAATGDKQARETINALAHPLIDYQTARFCKRFCSENQYFYRCTLKPPIGTQRGALRNDVAWCEWGNASYGWMLNDLCQEKRLLKYQGNNGARLFDYLYQIANSLPFYERWKDWRFARKVHVPTYIQALSPDAAKVFYALRNGDNSELIAQKTGRPLAQVESLMQQIIILLTDRKRLHLLDPPKLVSMSQANGETDSGIAELELAIDDETPEQQQEKAQVEQHIQQVWSKLLPAEQFVLEALIIEEQDAQDVLSALRQLQISIKPGVAAEQTSRQQLYYFRRKTLQKLALLMNE